MSKVIKILVRIYFVGLVVLIGLSFSIKSSGSEDFNGPFTSLLLILILILSIILAVAVYWFSKRRFVVKKVK